MDLPGDVELDATVRYVDSLAALAIDSYVVLDLRIGWRPTDRLELSIVGQNLFQRRHQEFRPTTIPTQTTEVEAGIYGRVTIRF
jgi:iron complex outermembrane receptor protein